MHFHPIKDKLWMAPELLRDPTLALMGTQKGDVYSAAIIMHEIMCRTSPFGCEIYEEAAEEVLDKVRRSLPPFRPSVSHLWD